MLFIFTIFRNLMELITLMLFCLISAYVWYLGKSATGIKLDYAFFAFICGVVFLIL